MIRIKEKLPYIIPTNKLQEIIGAAERCSNHTLLSFGACYDKPLMTWGDTLSMFREIFGDSSIEKLPVDLQKLHNREYTVRQFIEEFPIGHYILHTRRHVMAVHNGDLVDTAREGISRQKILTGVEIINHDRQLDAAFEEYLRQYPKNVFTKPKQKKPKYRFSIDDIAEVIKSFVRNRDKEEIYDETNRTAILNGFGKIIDGMLYLSKKEMEDVTSWVMSKLRR